MAKGPQRYVQEADGSLIPIITAEEAAEQGVEIPEPEPPRVMSWPERAARLYHEYNEAPRAARASVIDKWTKG